MLNGHYDFAKCTLPPVFCYELSSAVFVCTLHSAFTYGFVIHTSALSNGWVHWCLNVHTSIYIKWMSTVWFRTEQSSACIQCILPSALDGFTNQHLTLVNFGFKITPFHLYLMLG